MNIRVLTNSLLLAALAASTSAYPLQEMDNGLHSGLFGLARGQVAQVHVSNVGAPDTIDDPNRRPECRFAVAFFDSTGVEIKRAQTIAAAGQSSSFQLGFNELPSLEGSSKRRLTRAEIVGLDLRPDPHGCVAVLEIFDEKDGDTFFVGKPNLIPGGPKLSRAISWRVPALPAVSGNDAGATADDAWRLIWRRPRENSRRSKPSQVRPAMKLYTHLRAPNPNRVNLYLAEKAAGGAVIDLPQVKVDLRGGEQNTPAFLARNYFGAVPVLQLDDGSHIIESLTIIEYLEECYPAPVMIGRTALERARVRELERIAELRVLRPIGRIIHATNSPLAYPPNPGMAEHFRKVLPIGLRFFDERLSDGRPFIAGAQPSIADCTLAAALKFARFGELQILPGFENLARWDAEYRERAAVKSVLERLS